MTALSIIDWDGRQITKPGIYRGVPIRTYHEDPNLLDGPSISSSGLRTIFSRGAAAYWCTSPLNPLRIKKPEPDYFSLGRAAHTLLLGEEGFRGQYAIRPAIWKDWRKSEARQWRDLMRDAGLTVLTPEDIETIRGMAGLQPWQRPESGATVPESGLANSRLVRDGGLLEGHVELTMVWRDEATGVWVRSRPDVVPVHDGMIVDLKTSGTADPSRALWKYGYHAQGALAGEGLARLAGIEMTSFVLVFVRTSEPYAVTTHELVPFRDPDTGEDVDPIAIGREQNRKALDIFARCLAERSWPAADGEAREERVPLWYRREIAGPLTTTTEPEPEDEASEGEDA